MIILLILIEDSNGYVFCGFSSQFWNTSNNKLIIMKKMKLLRTKSFIQKIIIKKKNGKGFIFILDVLLFFGNHNSYELYLQKDLINRGYYKPRFYIWR